MPLASYLICSMVLMAATWATPMHSAFAQSGAPHPCGPLKRDGVGGYGPYDYRTEREKMRIVEPYHFTPQVEALIRGQSGYIGGDLSYLMRTSPNHHRGLMAIMRFVEKTNSPQPPHMQYTINCYFDRAIRFAPDDTVVRVLFAMYLNSIDKKPDAERQLREAITYAGDNPLSHYNIGLVLLEVGNFDLALAQAHKAQALGLTRPELEDKLRSVGKWREPEN